MNAVQYWVKKARDMNWLCIWPRTSNPKTRIDARAHRAEYMSYARRAKAALARADGKS